MEEEEEEVLEVLVLVVDGTDDEVESELEIEVASNGDPVYTIFSKSDAAPNWTSKPADVFGGDLVKHKKIRINKNIDKGGKKL